MRQQYRFRLCNFQPSFRSSVQSKQQAGRQQSGTKAWQLLGVSAIAWALLHAPSHAQSTPAQSNPTHSNSIPCGLFAEPQQFNTQASDDGVITVGYQPGRPYRLVLTQTNDTTFRSIKACVSDAFITRSRAGSYILVGSFDRRSEAERTRRTLRQAGYRARVVYMR